MKQFLQVVAIIALLVIIAAAMFNDAKSTRNHFTSKVSDYAGIGNYRSYLEANGFRIHNQTREGNKTTYVYLHKSNILFDVTITIEDQYDSLLGIRVPLAGRASGKIHLFSYTE